MFSHVMVGTNDMDAAQKFYDATFAVLGVGPGFIDPAGRLFYATSTGNFAVSKPIDGNPACAANGGTIGLAFDSPEKIDAWHAAGVANGGTTCEDPPGVRDMGDFGKLYLAYLRDPTGNKLCALHMMG